MFRENAVSESRPLDVRQVRTRSAIRDAFLGLIGSRHYDDISVGEIAQAAGIGYATFFRHFRGKDALLADVADGLITETMEKLAPLALAAESRAAALTLCRFVAERRSILTSLLVGGARNAVRDEMLARAIRQVDLSQTARVSWMPASLSAVHMVTSVLTIIGWWLEDGTGRSAEEMSVIIDRLVLAPAVA